jgi:hypothetical protein
MQTTTIAPVTGASAATIRGGNAGAEPMNGIGYVPNSGKFVRRIGSTTFTVGIHFSATSKETLEDKILRLLQGSREIRDFAGRGGATERSECPAQAGCSEVKSATTKREVTSDV